MDDTCKICNNKGGNSRFRIREMMFGTREEFEYFECSECGCLQIMDIPDDMSPYYPTDYYSFSKTMKKNRVIRSITRKRDLYSLFGEGIIGRIVHTISPDKLFEIIGHTGISHNSRILDIGCGQGNLLMRLEELGFLGITGIDPYIREETVTGELKILKISLPEFKPDQLFDLIMFNHSFEHMDDGEMLLRNSLRLLSDDGACMISMPIKTRSIWERYHTDWVQIDAPRHFFIHTLQSFAILAGRTDYRIDEVIFNSTELQFWGSEQYRRDIPLNAGISYSVNPARSIFTREEISRYRKLSEEMNRKREGDQGVFILRRKER